tara:strand:+ start:304 stop:1026 length:723 start_codon:yes stop_codon:yes gene_type:complete
MKEQIKRELSNIKFLKETKGKILTKATTGPSKIVRIPTEMTEELACFIGIILGDGTLNKSKKRITLELINKELIQGIARLTNKIFAYNPRIFSRQDKRPNRKEGHYFYIDNSSIHQYLNKVFKIPAGKKSNLIKVPDQILKSNKEILIGFFIGIFVTDGGKRHRGYGLSTASKEFRDDLSTILSKLNIEHKTDKWVHKKYKKEYYGLYFKKEEMFKMQECRSGQTGWILRASKKAPEVQA